MNKSIIFVIQNNELNFVFIITGRY